MSLLNDMLQDLQQQPDKDHEASEEHNRAQLRESGLIKTTTVPWTASILVFAGVLIILLLVKQQFIYPAKKTVDAVANSLVGNTQQRVPQVPDIANLVPVAENQLDNNPPLQNLSLTDVPPSSPNLTSIPAEQQEKIGQLLMLARQAIARDRLTSPFEDNAYRYYQEILAIEPNNVLATQGLLQLADSYLAMADKKLTAGNREAAQQLLQRAQLVAPEYPAVIDFKMQLDSLPGEVQEAVSLAAPKETNNQVPETVDASIVTPAAQQTHESVSIKDPFAADTATPHLSVTPNTHWQDQQQVQQAKFLIQQGKVTQAILALKDFIADNQGAVESTRLLLDIYCEQKQVEEGQQLLASATYLEKQDQLYFKARIALINGQNQDAITLLESGLSAAEKNESYRALLAGIYQKAAYYPQAASSYKRLLEVFGEKPAYWLGYALALDAMEQKASALQAYRRLSEYQELQTEVRHYIEQRIAALQS